jgi:hypothetical protein
MITDITQNGAESGASLVELELCETLDSPGAGSRGELRFTVKDNGKGMTDGELERAQDPFVTDGIKHPHRKVGLGLPFLIQTAEQSGGGWKIESKKHSGTTVSAWFDLGNVDTPPVGDIPGMFRTVLIFDGPAEMVIRRSREIAGERVDYEVRKTELIDALGGLEDTQSLILLNQYLHSLEEAEFGSGRNEVPVEPSSGWNKVPVNKE